MDKIGKYKILGELGREAMGIVYKGEDPLIGRIVAIKTIRMDAFHKPHQKTEATQRFIREAQSAGNLSHPNIVTIFDVGQSEGTTYIAMEYIQGQSLDMLIAFRKEFSLDGIIHLIAQIGSALDYAHMQGIVHRDIKPGNILINNSGKAQIVDFGIARISSSTLTQTGTSLGTPNYMSPEQVAGRKVDHRADIFALGAILYELLTFEKPFSGDSFTTIIYKIMNEEPPPLRTFNARMPEELDLIIRKSLAKIPEDRYQTCKDLVNDLSNYQTLGTTLIAKDPLTLGVDRAIKKETKKVDTPAMEREIEKEKAPTEEDQKKPKRRNPLLFGLASAAGLAAVLTAVYFIFLKDSRLFNPSIQGTASTQVTEAQVQPPPPPEDSQANTEIIGLLETGTKAYEDEDYDLCIQTMEQVLQLDPLQSRAEYFLTEATKRKADQEQAQTVQNSIRLAQNVFQEKDYEEAIRLSESVLSIDSENSEAKDFLLRSHLQLGILSFNRGEYTQSITTMDEVLKLDPQNRTARDYIDRAKEQQAVQLSDLDLDTTLQLAEEAHRNQNYQECIQQTEKVLLLDEDNARAKELRSLSLFQLGKQAFDNKNYSQAIQRMESALSIDPQNRDARDYIQKSRDQLRIQQINGLLDQAQKAYEDKDFEQTLKLSEDILSLDSDNQGAKEFSNRASLQLAPKEINALIGEYIQSVKDDALSEFYALRCAPSFYNSIKSETEAIMKSFSDLDVSLSDVSIQFQEISHARVGFSQVLTGTSITDRVTTVLSDGNMEWEIKKMDGNWKITDMLYTHRREMDRI